MRKTLNLGDGYRIRATRKKVGTFAIVAIDWEHPNYGYFADAMLWVRAPHLDEWVCINVVKWGEKYRSLESFLKKYPEFSKLFEFDPFEEIRGAIRKIFESRKATPRKYVAP